MADKEATVFILDLGSSMAEAHSGRSESNLDWSMKYVWDKITDIVSANRKTLCVGVVGLRTDTSNNKLQEDEGYENISVLQDLGPMTMSSLRTLQNTIEPSGTAGGDAISAIVIAVDLIDIFTKKLKYIRKVILITDGEGPMDADDVDDIASKMNESNIELTVLGVDFDDSEYGFKEEDKSLVKAENEAKLKSLVDKCNNGVFATIKEAIDELDIPRVKQTRPYKSYEGALTLGDPETFPAAVKINVERFFKTHLARPLAASTVAAKPEDGTSQSTQTMPGDEMDGLEFSAVRQTRAYKVNDPSAPGGKRDVEFDTLAKGYQYGRTAVPISESEHNITKLETVKSFSIIGFVDADKYEPFLNLGEVNVTHARKYDEKSEVAMSSLIWAMIELEYYAIARIVLKDGKDPLVVLLVPFVDVSLECLYDIPLPFAEDIRTYQFPPLDRVVTITGQTLTQHRFLPSDELNQAMSDYVDAMDISVYGQDDEGEPAEYCTVDESFNPSIHRVNHAVKTRAIYTDGPVPEIPKGLLQFQAPPEQLIEQVKNAMEALIDAADVKKVPPKAKGKRRRDPVKPISGLDVDALLGGEHKGKVSAENAIPDFKNALNTATSVEEIEDASKQMGTIIRDLITESFGDSKYEQAMESFGVLREELISLEEPQFFNAFVKDLKKSLLSGALGGDRRDFWFKVRYAKLGLIDKLESEVSEVKTEEAEQFLTSR